MLKTKKMMILFIAILGFLFCDNSVNSTDICVDAVANATIHKIGYSASNSILSVCFVNSLSYCTPDFPYETNRIDVSLVDFKHAYTSKKAENPELLPLPQGSQVLFNGDLACHDSCRIPISIVFPGISIEYIMRTTGDIVLKLDTNGTKDSEFKIWDFN